MSTSTQTCITCTKTHSNPDHQWNCHNVSGVEGPLCHKCENKPMNVLNCALAGEYDCECFDYCSLYFELLTAFAPFAEESDEELTKRIIKSATADNREFHCEWTPSLLAALREEEDECPGCQNTDKARDIVHCFFCQTEMCNECFSPHEDEVYCKRCVPAESAEDDDEDEE
jgi:hypothetical protein